MMGIAPYCTKSLLINTLKFRFTNLIPPTIKSQFIFLISGSTEFLRIFYKLINPLLGYLNPPGLT